MIKKIFKELDFKSVTRDNGILATVFLCFLTLLCFILFIPFCPLFVFNEWSKGWFKEK